MKLFLAALIALAPVVGETRFERFERDLARVRAELRIAKIAAAVVQGGRVEWRHNDGLDGKQVDDLIEAVRLVEATEHPPGWFNQTYSGEPILWAFSQNDDSSTLILKIPNRKLSFIVRANSKALTEAGRLEDGNIARSAVALAFLEEIVFDRSFPRDEMENRALAAFYFGEREQSTAIMQEALQKYAELQSADDVTLLHLLAELHLPATEGVATTVLKEHPDLPAAWLYYGRYLRSQKRFREATLCFKKITEHQPPLHHWSVAEAEKELSTLQ